EEDLDPLLVRGVDPHREPVGETARLRRLAQHLRERSVRRAVLARQLLPQRRSEELRLVGVGPELRQRRGAQPKVGLAPDELDRSKALDALDEEKNASLST